MSKTTSQRGYGRAHQLRRQGLMAALVEGSPCDWCGRPMYRDASKNFDGASLEADHEDALATHGVHGNLATRLLHRKCNRQRGVGVDDAQSVGDQVVYQSVFEW